MNDFYDEWVADGKPSRLARPIAELVALLRAQRADAVTAGCFGTIGDIPHLTDDWPQDHTPYSRTGWPLSHPYPYVTALDICRRPDLGVDCDQIFTGLMTAARAGVLPWLKYVCWGDYIYAVWNGWQPVPNDFHDHIHVSSRTDHLQTSLNGWNPLGADMLTDEDVRRVADAVWERVISSPALAYTDQAQEWLKYTVEASRDIKVLSDKINNLAGGVTEEMHDRVMRRILGSLDGSVPEPDDGGP